MKLVSVSPLVRGAFREDLTYFTAQEVAAGDLVLITLRNRKVRALVTGVEPLAAVKSALRQADFNLKKIDRIVARQFIDSAVLAAAQATANYYAASLGGVLRQILPQILLTEKLKARVTKKLTKKSETDPDLKTEKLALQDHDAERQAYYKSLARQEFAKKHSLLICLPTAAELRAVQAKLAKGITHYTVPLHSQLKPAELVENWQRATNDTHVLLILTTPAYLMVPRHDLSTIILERESSPHYRPLTRPLIDYRHFAEKLAENRHCKLIYGDILLRPEITKRLTLRELVSAQPLRQRLISRGETKLVRVTTAEIWSDEARTLLEKNNQSGEKIFLLANRRGLSPLIVCEDCGHAVTCGNCDTPLVLHEAGVKNDVREKTSFRCHQCGEKRSSEESCRHCQSWRLRALGTGVERIARELKTLAPARPIFQIDSDHTKTARQAEQVITKFQTNQAGILLGTELALNYLSEPVPTSMIVTIDAMLAIPDFRISERVFNLIARLRALTNKELLIQTRQEENETLYQASNGLLLDFYKSEIALREKLDYPPFVVFIKVTRDGASAESRTIFQKLTTHFASYHPVVYPALHQPGHNKLRLNLLLKIKPENWPDPVLINQLKVLPPDFIVAVDPDSVL